MAYGYGLVPVGSIGGAPYTGGLVRMAVPAADTADIYPGDPVLLDGGSTADGVPTIDKCGATSPIFGVVVSVDSPLVDNRTYVLGSDATNVQYVLVAPAVGGTLFKCGASAALTAGAVGSVADTSVVAGASPYYTSKTVLDQGTLATSGTAQLQIVGFVQNGKSVTAADADVVVRVMEPQIGVGAVSAGI